MPDIDLKKRSWYTRIDDADPSRPSILVWEIHAEHGVERYVGRAVDVQRRLNEFRQNVQNILDEKPYHGGSERDFRSVHRALAKAVTDERSRIVVRIVENAAEADLPRRQSELAKELNAHLNVR